MFNLNYHKQMILGTALNYHKQMILGTVLKEYTLEQLQYLVDNLDNLFEDSSNPALDMKEYFKTIKSDENGSILQQLKYWYKIRLRDKNLDKLLNE